jgi:competence protein ComFC
MDKRSFRLKKYLRSFGEGFLDLFFPSSPSCPLCQRVREKKTANGPFCRECSADLENWRRRPGCVICGRPLQAGRRCPQCRREEPVFALARTAAPYEGAYRDAIHRLKFHGQQWLAAPLGEMMAQLVQEETLYGQPDLIVPVPLHGRKAAARGFNQSELLARVISRSLDRPLVLGVLVKVRETPDQMSLSRRERQENLQGAFSLRNSLAVKGQAVLLVDDIFTTGSTANHCSRVLIQGGARRVAVISWAGGKLD